MVPLQSLLATQAAHMPADAPDNWQVGNAIVGQTALPAPPKLPLHAAHTSRAPAVLHAGVAGTHRLTFAVVHPPQVRFVVSHTAPLALAAQSAFV